MVPHTAAVLLPKRSRVCISSCLPVPCVLSILPCRWRCSEPGPPCRMAVPVCHKICVPCVACCTCARGGDAPLVNDVWILEVQERGHQSRPICLGFPVIHLPPPPRLQLPHSHSGLGQLRGNSLAIRHHTPACTYNSRRRASTLGCELLHCIVLSLHV